MRKLTLGKRLLGLALAGLVMMVGPIAGPRPASARTSGVTDPAGDTNWDAPAFQDIVYGEIQKKGGSFFLRMDMAGSIPDNPPLVPPGTSEIWWIWSFDLDSQAVPAGYPFPPGLGLPLPAEFMVYVAWDGVKFTGNAIDRRPLLTGQDAIVTSIPFSIDGKTLKAVLASPSDFPASFGWGTRVYAWTAPPGNAGGLRSIDVGGPFFNPFP